MHVSCTMDVECPFDASVGPVLRVGEKTVRPGLVAGFIPIQTQTDLGCSAHLTGGFDHYACGALSSVVSSGASALEPSAGGTRPAKFTAENPVVVVGGSHTAWSCVWALLNDKTV